MREVKFRAYIEMENKIADVCTIDFDDRSIGVLEINLMGHPYIKMWDFDQVILMQYTGLKDKNGTKIYDKDILYWEDLSDLSDGTLDSNVLVFWDDEHLRWSVKVIERKMRVEGLYDYTISEEIEIIGNVSENPELLEVEQ